MGTTIPNRLVRGKWLAVALPGVVLGLLVLLSLGISLGGEFVWDDRPLISENPLIKSPGEIGTLLTSSFWEADDQHDRFRSFFRPVVSLSFAVDYALWGLGPFGFHLTNLLLHLLCCLLVYRIALAEGIAAPAALAGAALFAVHPVHVESVAWISGRTDLLCALFVLASFLIHRGVSNRVLPKSMGILSLALFVAALFSKEMAATLPLLVFLDRWLDGSSRPRRLASATMAAFPDLAVLGLCLAARWVVLGPGAEPLFNLGGESYLATSLFAVARYVTILILPIGLDAHYPYAPVESLLGPLALLPAAMLLVVFWATWRLARRRDRAAFWTLWIFVSLLPVLAFGRFGDVLLADRFLYIPSVGLAIVAARFVAPLLVDRRRRIAAVACVTALLVMVPVTWKRSTVWQDDYALFSDMLKTSPESALVRYNLGLAFYREGEVERATEEFRQAVRLAPGYSLAHNNLAAALDRQDLHDEALAHYRLALHYAPGLSEAWANAGNLLVRLGRHSEGLRMLDHLAARRPRDPEGLYALADGLYRAGRSEEAIEHLSRARSLDPSYAEPHYLLGKILHEKGSAAEAATSMRRFLELWPEEGKFTQAARRVIARAERTSQDGSKGL